MNKLPEWCEDYTDQLEVEFGQPFTLDPNFVYGTSSLDGQYNRTLGGLEITNSAAHSSAPEGFEKSLILNTGKNPVAYVVTNSNKKDEYYKFTGTSNDFNDLTFNVVNPNNNVTHDVEARLVIECLDMYGNEVQVEVPFTIKKR